MGWRLHWYKADKENPITIIHEVDDDESYDYCKVNGTQILWCEATEDWLDLSDEERNNTDYFIKLHSDEDTETYEVTKEGVKLFIEKYRQRIIKILSEAIKSDDEREWNYTSNELYTKQKLGEFSMNIAYDLKEYKDKNGNIENQFEITSSWKYEYCIFNLIAIYKLFDFENYKLVINGG